MDKIRVAVIGIGNMGSAHASCVAKGEIKGMELTAVCDISTEKNFIFSKNFPDIKCYTDFNNLLSDKIANAVIIATPHPLHTEMAIAALKGGMNVLVEKPVDITVSKAERLNTEAKKSGRVFGIMFNQRTNPLYIKAREIVKSGALGEIKRTVWIITNWYRTQHYYDSGDWRATWSGEGGGVLLNQAPHNLDLLQWICGMPESILSFCDRAKYHDVEVEDDATIILRYKNGATGTFITSTGEYPGTNRLEISGDMGKIVLENGTLKWWKLKENEREVCHTSNEGFAQIPYEYTEIKEDNNVSGHKIILQNFANAILFGEELIAPGAEGINELIISNAAYLSSWKGNMEIPLPIDTKEFDRLLKEKQKASQKRQNTASKISSGEYIDRWKTNW